MIRDRIVDLRRVKACDLEPNPHNWRTHPDSQRAAMRAVLEEVGYVDVAIARELPDGRLELLDGHLRRDLTPDAEIPVVVVDVDDQEAAKVLATLDPLAAMAQKDAEQYDSLLETLEPELEAFRELLEDLANQPHVALNDEHAEPEDYGDLDAELESLEGSEDVTIAVVVPRRHFDEVNEWLRNDESNTGPGRGRGVLKRCGLL